MPTARSTLPVAGQPTAHLPRTPWPLRVINHGARRVDGLHRLLPLEA